MGNLLDGHHPKQAITFSHYCINETWTKRDHGGRPLIVFRKDQRPVPMIDFVLHFSCSFILRNYHYYLVAQKETV